MSLAAAMQRVYDVRKANEDVFIWPSVEWDLLYTHEELTELARVIQKLKEPDHARNHDDTSMTMTERLHLEFGQAVMMLLTTGIAIGITEPDYALEMACTKIELVSARKRAAKEEIK